MVDIFVCILSIDIQRICIQSVLFLLVPGNIQMYTSKETNRITTFHSYSHFELLKSSHFELLKRMSNSIDSATHQKLP